MTTAQRYTLLIDGGRKNPGRVSLWTAACKTQGWDKNDRALRIKVISHAVGRPIKSTSELNHTTDIDRVFTFLRAAADDLDAARELDQPDMAAARRLLWKIEEVKSQLAAFLPPRPTRITGATPDPVNAYVAEIIRDKFNHGRSRRVEIITETDLDADQLRQLLITLTARLKDLIADDKTLQRNLEAEPVPAGDAPEDDNQPF